jgi:hypothetical protein
MKNSQLKKKLSDQKHRTALILQRSHKKRKLILLKKVN